MKKLITILFVLLLTGCQPPMGQVFELPAEKAKIQRVTAPENNTFKMGEQNYQTEFKDNISDDNSLQYKLDDKYIAFKPLGMKWNTETVNFKEVQSITKESLLGGTSDKVLYKEAIETGIDIEMRAGQRTWSKVIKINSSKDLGAIPKDAEYLELSFAFDTNFVIDGWDGESEMEITDKVRVGDYSYLEPARAWDSYSSTTCETIDEEEVCTELTNNVGIKSFISEGLYKKQIPVEWIKNAEFPVYADVDIVYGSPQEFEDATDNHSAKGVSVVELDTDKFVVCWYNGVGYDVECRAATVSGTTITFGAISKADDVGSFTIGNKSYACKLDTDKFVVVTGRPTTGFYAQVSTVSTRTIAEPWGTQATLDTGDVEWATCTQLDTDKFAVCYNDETNSDTGTCSVSTVSGTTITVGSETPIDGNNGATKDYYPKYGKVAQLDTDKFVYCFEEEESSDDPGCIAASVSTRTISYGGWNNIETNNAQQFGVTSQSTDKFVVAYYDITGTEGNVVGGSVSGETISYGSIDQFVDGSNSAEINKVVAIDSTHVVLVHNNGGSSVGTSNYTSVTDATPPETTPGSEEGFEGDTGGTYADAGLNITLISPGKIVICYQDDADSDKGKCIIGDAPYTPEEPEGTNTQINIGDAWKAIEGMQINIGDAWKAVEGAQINIGDSWETIY